MNVFSFACMFYVGAGARIYFVMQGKEKKCPRNERYEPIMCYKGLTEGHSEVDEN